jgi:NTE family protein
MTEAIKYVEILDKLPKKNFDNLRMPINPIYSNIYKIDDIEVENNKIYDKDYIIGKMTLKLPHLKRMVPSIK